MKILRVIGLPDIVVLSPAGPPDCWAWEPGKYGESYPCKLEWDGWNYALRVFRRDGHVQSCFWQGKLRGSGTGPAGEYHQDVHGPYNPDHGIPRLTVEFSTREDLIADAARTLTILKSGCRECPDYLNSGATEVMCKSGGTVSTRAGACPKGMWSVDTSGNVVVPKLTPRTDPGEILKILEGDPGEEEPWPDGFQHWENVREAHRRGAARAGSQIVLGGGRGVVIVGGGRYFTSAYVNVRLLRHLGCTLPIELWHLPNEMDPGRRALLEPYGVKCVQARTVDMRVAGGWQLKSLAVERCAFDEVLYLDADSHPTQDPTFLFSHPRYLEHGAVFWPDSEKMNALVTPDTWAAVGLPFRDEVSYETGQFIVDKRRCAQQVAVARWMDDHSHFYYRLWHGDTGTWPFAWRVTGTSFWTPPRRWDWSVHTMRQYDPDGTFYLFSHRCRDKFSLAPDKREQKLFSNGQISAQNTRNPALPNEDFCFDVLEELKDLGAEQTERLFLADFPGAAKLLVVFHHSNPHDPAPPADWDGHAIFTAEGALILHGDHTAVLSRQEDGTWQGPSSMGRNWMLIPQ